MEFFGDGGDGSFQDPVMPHSSARNLFPDTVNSHGDVVRRDSVRSEGIDLNSQASSFPNFTTYQDILMSDGVTDVAGGRRAATGKRHAVNNGPAATGKRRAVSDGPAAMPLRPFCASQTAEALNKRSRGSRGGTGAGGRGGLPRSTSAAAGSGVPPRSTSAATGSGGPLRSASANAGSGGPPWVGAGTGGSGLPSRFPYSSSGNGAQGQSFSGAAESSSAPFMFTAGENVGGGGGSTSPVDGVQSFDEDDDPFGGPSGDTFDKAIWTTSPVNTTIFCEICVEEIRAGNRSNGNMTSRGYKNIAEKYYLSTGLRHCRVQLKNRWDQLKGLYSFWLRLNRETGLGRSANGTVVADDNFWKTQTKKHSEWKQLRNGPPKNLELLEQMFEHTAVDGSTSCAPGESTNEGAGDDEDDGCDRNEATPMSNSRAMNRNSCATSPLKKGKSPMLKVMKGMWGTMQSNSDVAKKVMEGELRTESINKAMRLTVECGAPEGSVEHYMATKLFVKAENRDIFFTFTTTEGRISWLRRNCQERNLV